MSLISEKSVAFSGALKSRKMVGLAAAVIVSGLSIWASSGFTREPPPPKAETPGMKVGADNVQLAPDAPQWKVLKLAAVQPASVHLTEAVPARVRIDERLAAKVGSPLAGRLTSVSIELGQHVKMGEALFSVASPDIAGLRAEREKANVDVEISKMQLDRIKAMVAAHALPAKDEIEATQQMRQAQVALHLAQSKLASLRVSSRADNEFVVVSPREGVVVEKNILPAQEVSQDAALVVIADLSSVWVVADVFEADVLEIRQGSKARVTSPSIPDFSADAEVEMVSSVVDPVRHTVPVRVRLANPDGRLKPNIFAQMRFPARVADGAMEIAASSIVSDGAHQYAYIQDRQGQFSRREVIAGSVHEGRVSIFKGLASGDVVVEEGAILLDNQVVLSN